MLINDFSGGLSLRLAPHLININEAVICENVDTTSGSLKPLKGLLATNKTITKPIFTEFKGTYIKNDLGSTYAEFNDTLYIASDKLRKTNDGLTISEIGITGPNNLLTTTEDFTFSYTFSNKVAGTDINFNQGTYTYLIQYKTISGSINYSIATFYYTGTKGITLTINNSTDLEYVQLYRKLATKYRFVGESTSIIDDLVYDISSKPSMEAYSQMLGTRQYVYTYYSSTTGFESSPSKVSLDLDVEVNRVTVTGFIASTDRSVDGIKLYRLGGTLTDFYLVDTILNTATTYTDTKSDIQVLDGTLLTTTGFIKPPNIKFITIYNGALFGVVDNILWFSNSGLPDQWTQDNWIAIPEHVTGLGVTQNGLLIFSRNKTWILIGGSIDNYSLLLLNGNQGCVSHSTISYVENNLVWYSLDGICVSQGGNIELLSWPKLGKVIVKPICSETYENQYFLFHETGTLVIDFRLGVKFYNLSLIVRGAYYNPSYDKLYILKPTDIGMYEYNAGTNLTYKYKTGRLAEQGLNNCKVYKNLYIYSFGTSILKIYLDGVLINTVNIVAGLNDILYPQSKSRGYYTELEFEGTGEIAEINFLTEGRQNGR